MANNHVGQGKINQLLLSAIGNADTPWSWVIKSLINKWFWRDFIIKGINILYVKKRKLLRLKWDSIYYD